MREIGEMACDRAEDRTLLLSLGLFGIPTGREERARELPGSDECQRREGEESRSAR
jgi:hypothetical protein